MVGGNTIVAVRIGTDLQAVGVQGWLPKGRSHVDSQTRWCCAARTNVGPLEVWHYLDCSIEDLRDMTANNEVMQLGLVACKLGLKWSPKSGVVPVSPPPLCCLLVL